MVAYDNAPIRIQYVSFGTTNDNSNAKIEYYYDCPYFPHATDIRISELQLPKNTIHSLYSLNEFQTKCARFNASDDLFKGKYVQFLTKDLPNGYLFRAPIYVIGAHDAIIYFTEKNDRNLNDKAYEIGNRIHFIFV